MTPKTSLSVFFPAYNEEANLKTTVEKSVGVLKKLKIDFEVIIVNDGSLDGTGRIAEDIARKNPRVRVITHNPNRGYGGALISGLYAAKKELIAFNDSDGQFDFAEIKRFLPYFPRDDLVIGYRVHRAEGMGRQLVAEALKIWDFCFFGIWFKDIDCAFKVIKRKSLYQFPRLKTNTAMISTELLVKAKRAGLAIKEVPVTHLPDRADKNRRARGGHPIIILKAVKGTFDLWRSL